MGGFFEAWFENVLTQNILVYALAEFPPHGSTRYVLFFSASRGCTTNHVIYIVWGKQQSLDLILAADFLLQDIDRSVHAQTEDLPVRMQVCMHIRSQSCFRSKRHLFIVELCNKTSQFKVIILGSTLQEVTSLYVLEMISFQIEI